MQCLRALFVCSIAVAAALTGASAGTAVTAQQAPASSGSSIPAAAQQLFNLANQVRAAAGVGPLKWDSALAAGAMLHCERMAAEGSLSHRFGGEPDLTLRAQNAGVHFSRIEENIALSSSISKINQGWLDSPAHRANLLNPQIDSVGIALVFVGGVYYAVADYALVVQVLTNEEVEAVIAGLIRPSGVSIVRDPADARAYCATGSSGTSRGLFLMVWEGPDISTLPQPLSIQIASGEYRSAAVGACAVKGAQSGFTSYRVAVILY
jgi:uncharacterized protein YkwD